MMNVSFGSRKLAKMCSQRAEIKKAFGKSATKLELRLGQLRGVRNLADLAAIPGARCHPLLGDRAGEFAVDLVHPHRLIFRPSHDPLPRKDDGGLDAEKVTDVVVVEVGDYH